MGWVHDLKEAVALRVKGVNICYKTAAAGALRHSMARLISVMEKSYINNSGPFSNESEYQSYKHGSTRRSDLLRDILEVDANTVDNGSNSLADSLSQRNGPTHNYQDSRSADSGG